MSELGAHTLLAFRDELEKVASRVPGMGAMMGLGMLGGAAYNGLRKGRENYTAAREYGVPVGDSLAYGLQGAAGGAAKGALVGGAAGLGLGALAPKMTGSLASRLQGSEGILGKASRFGRRQIHGLTGKDDIRAIRGGAWDAEQNLITKAKQRAAILERGPAAPGAYEAASKDLSRARAAHEAMSQAEEKGLTNLPGVAKGLLKNPLNTMRLGVQAQLAGTTTREKALLGAGLGMGALQSYQQATSGPEETRGRRLGGALGGLAGNLALSPLLPLSASLGAGTLISRGGEALGQGRDALRARRRTPIGDISAGSMSHPSESAGQTTHGEVIRTPSASGQVSDMVSA